jgi:hypothetical protein
MCDILTCTCCGIGLRDTMDENVSHGQVPYPHDTGYGLCRECGGDPTADTATEEGIRRRMGWQVATFCEARIDLVQRNLKSEAQAKWDRLSYAKKCCVVLGLVKDGTFV